MIDLEKVLARVKAAGAQAGMIDPADASRYIDVDALKVSADDEIDGLDSAFVKLRETKPYLFREPLVLERIHEQIAEFGRRESNERDRRLADFIKSDADLDKKVAAVKTGYVGC